MNRLLEWAEGSYFHFCQKQMVCANSFLSRTKLTVKFTTQNTSSDNEEFINQFYAVGLDMISTITILAKRSYLKIHEARKNMVKNRSLKLEDVMKAANLIDPLSANMIKVLEKQIEKGKT